MIKNKTSIKTQTLCKTLKGEVPVTLVKDATIEIYEGESVAITGPSGSGKSSLLYLLGLLDDPTSGKIWIKDVETTKLSSEDLTKLKLSELGFVFQFHFLLPEFSALENVLLPMQRLAKFSESEMKDRASQLLKSLGLGDQMHKLPKQLSGGQSQRVAIARALANDPAIIFADEPTGNLDTISSENVQTILIDLAKNQNKTIVVVTHDLNFAKQTNRIIQIVDGKIVNEDLHL